MKEQCPFCGAKRSITEASTYECGSRARVIYRELGEGPDEEIRYVDQSPQCKENVTNLLTNTFPDLPNKPKVVATIETVHASIKIYSDGSVKINGCDPLKLVTDHVASPFTAAPHYHPDPMV